MPEHDVVEILEAESPSAKEPLTTLLEQLSPITSLQFILERPWTPIISSASKSSILLLLPSGILFDPPLLAVFVELTGNAGSSLVAAALERLEINLFCLVVVFVAFELDLSKLFALNDKEVVEGCCEIIAAEHAAST